MAHFTIKDNDTSKLIVESHYYAWLKENKPSDIHKINTKVNYLVEQGFVIGIDYIGEEQLMTLKSIEDTYFSFEIKPTL